MSQENVELAWRLADAWNRRDVKPRSPFGTRRACGIHRSKESPRDAHIAATLGFISTSKHVTEFLSPESQVEYSDVRDLGDRVLALGRARFNFVSGVVLDQELGFLQTWRNGRCIELRAWMDHAAALKAAGLSE